VCVCVVDLSASAARLPRQQSDDAVVAMDVNDDDDDDDADDVSLLTVSRHFSRQ